MCLNTENLLFPLIFLVKGDGVSKASPCSLFAEYTTRFRSRRRKFNGRQRTRKGANCCQNAWNPNCANRAKSPQKLQKINPSKGLRFRIPLYSRLLPDDGFGFCFGFQGWDPFVKKRESLWKLRKIRISARNLSISGWNIGAAGRIWTADLILTKDALYRLSYSSVFF